MMIIFFLKKKELEKKTTIKFSSHKEMSTEVFKSEFHMYYRVRSDSEETCQCLFGCMSGCCLQLYDPLSV